MQSPRMQPVRYEMIRLRGGLDIHTPTLDLPPGFARRATNFECGVNGGYRRIAGYERFSGKARPSDATYLLLTCTFTGTIAVGNTVTGSPSGATGVCIAVTSTYVVLTAVSGTFAAADTLTVGGPTVATVTEVTGVSNDGALDATYLNLAADYYRALIAAVPGSGPIRGVVFYQDVVYAWRNNVGNTAMAIYKSTGSGWTAITLGEEISFTNANSNVNEGDTLTQGGVTATISRIVLLSGTLGSGVNTGRLVITGRSGGNFAAGAATSTGAGAITLSGAQTAITLNPSGRVEAVVANFGGGTANYRIYGADGVNRGFEFDGTTYVPITTGMTTDTPKHVAVHKQMLFFTFGASLQFSGLGTPYIWSPLSGAGELAMNAEITNLLVMPGDQSTGALAVYTRRDTSILYGTSSSTFTLVPLNTGTGAIGYSGQNMDQGYVLDDSGVTSLKTTLAFGNFTPSALTVNIRKFVQQHITLTTASTVNRDLGQYRIFFSDNSGLYVTVINGKMVGAMPVEFEHTVYCTTEGQQTTGVSRSFFGTDDGYVMEMDCGTSFDGEPIAANFTLTFDAIGSPRILKRFRKGSVEVTGDGYCEFDFGYSLGYDTTLIDQPSTGTYTADLRDSYFDSFTWDSFVFDQRTLQPAETEVCGTAENIAVAISSVSDEFEAFTINSTILHYTARRGLR